jgi:molybdenum cofactor biosynthesis enzyme
MKTTTKELIDTGVTPGEANATLNTIMHLGKAAIVGKVENTGKRGKPSHVYEVDDAVATALGLKEFIPLPAPVKVEKVKLPRKPRTPKVKVEVTAAEAPATTDAPVEAPVTETVAAEVPVTPEVPVEVPVPEEVL